ncbi:MAG: HNH endonuclease signature motif containing protein, partial [Nocardioidaceae bacterium]
VAPFLRALETGVLDGAEPVRLARRHGRLPGLHLHLHPDTLAGADHRAAELRGFGPIPAALGRALAASAQTRHPVEQGLPTGEGEPGPEPGYRPSRALAEHVEQRDRTCRFPGCWRRADGCDLDHTRPHPAGATQAGNLGVLCRRHHRFKHSPGVHLDQPRPGHFHWHLPTGHHYTVDPPET